MSFYKEQSAVNPVKRYRKKKVEDPVVEVDHEEKLYHEFLKDWAELRTHNEAQKIILDEVFEKDKKYIFARIGRKGSKTTTNIDIAWKFCMKKSRRTVYICLPTITLGKEVYWDEKRIQWCDAQDSHMYDKYISHIDKRELMLTFVNGSSIKIIGTWNEARGRGTQPNLLIVDEVQDASSEYLDAMEPNLAAKPDAICVMTGTPPRKRNHYHEWEERIRKNPNGFTVKYSSYVNTSLPHLKGWLDNKRLELIAAKKEDVWLREYMAEDCFRSDDRVLPDVSFIEFDQMILKLKSLDISSFQPILGVVVTDHHITVTYNVMIHSRFTGTQIYTLESQHINRIWNRSYEEIYGQMCEKMEEYSCVFKKSWRKVVFDETESFSDVISGITKARADMKWTKRGIPLLKEMILSNKLFLSTKASDIGLEAQNLLKEDDVRDYPILCAMAMIANEFYQAPCMNRYEQQHWDKMAPLREAGLVVNMPKQKFIRPYMGKYS